jgi:hypothetical protein
MAQTSEEINAQKRAYYYANKDWLREKQKQYEARPENKARKKDLDKERSKTRIRKKWSDLDDREKQLQREGQKRYYQRHKDRIKSKRRTYRTSDDGRKKELERHKKYRKTEHGKYLNNKTTARLKHQRRALEKDMSPLDVFVFNEAFDLRLIRQKLFNIKWSIDHIIPVTKGGNNAYTNIQVVPASWNSRKGNKHTKKYFGGQDEKDSTK